jgi:hypothetical protein
VYVYSNVPYSTGPSKGLKKPVVCPFVCTQRHQQICGGPAVTGPRKNVCDSDLWCVECLGTCSVQAPKREEMLLHGEQNGKRLAASSLCLSGEDGGIRSERRGGRHGKLQASFPVLVISGPSSSCAWTDHCMQPITGRWLTPHGDPGTWPSSTLVPL